MAFTVYSLILARFYLRRHDRAVVRDLVLMTLLELAVSPISWWHHNTIALLPFLYLGCTTSPCTGSKWRIARWSRFSWIVGN